MDGKNTVVPTDMMVRNGDLKFLHGVKGKQGKDWPLCLWVE